jgi:hypothetical protein
MTKDEIIKLARNAGARIETFYLTSQFPNTKNKEHFCGYVMGYDQIVEFALSILTSDRNRIWTKDHWTAYEHAIAAAEREECANVCDSYDVAEDVNSCDTAEGIAIAIRARGIPHEGGHYER